MADWQWKSRYLDSVVSGVGFLACVDHFGDINEMVFSVAPCLCVRLSINPGQNEWIPAFAGMTWGKPRRVLILLGALKIAGFFLDGLDIGRVPFVGAEVDGFALGAGDAVPVEFGGVDVAAGVNGCGAGQQVQVEVSGIDEEGGRVLDRQVVLFQHAWRHCGTPWRGCCGRCS